MKVYICLETFFAKEYLSCLEQKPRFCGFVGGLSGVIGGMGCQQQLAIGNCRQKIQSASQRESLALSNLGSYLHEGRNKPKSYFSQDQSGGLVKRFTSGQIMAIYPMASILERKYMGANSHSMGLCLIRPVSGAVHILCCQPLDGNNAFGGGGTAKC